MKQELVSLEISNENQKDISTEFYEIMSRKILILVFLIFFGLSIFLVFIIKMIPDEEVVLVSNTEKTFNDNFILSTKLTNITKFHRKIEFGFVSKSLFDKPIIAIASGSFYEHGKTPEDDQMFNISEKSYIIRQDQFTPFYKAHKTTTTDITSTFSFILIDGQYHDLLFVWKYINIIYSSYFVLFRMILWVISIIICIYFIKSSNKMISNKKQLTLQQQLMQLITILNIFFLFPWTEILEAFGIEELIQLSHWFRVLGHSFYFGAFSCVSWSNYYRTKEDVFKLKLLVQMHLIFMIFYALTICVNGKTDFDYLFDGTLLYGIQAFVCLNVARIPLKVDSRSTEFFSAILHLAATCLSTFASSLSMRKPQRSSSELYYLIVNIMSIFVICLMHWPVDETNFSYQTTEDKAESLFDDDE